MKTRLPPLLSGCMVLCLVLSLQASGGSQTSQSDHSFDWAQAREFWSFRAPVAHKLPAVKHKNWPRQALDHFILTRLENQGLAPASPADRRTLIRRVTFDLTGLPPTPEEVAAFSADQRADAYEQLVQRLLASPRFGERMASMWLPLARFAEDQAHQVGSDTKFFYPNAHLYRDWIVNAFNRDLPYDRFSKLQLAADKMEGTDRSDLAALGLLGLGPKYYNRNRLEVMADEWEDRVDTVTRTFLGLTVACARCHDHKFDPITQRDYYALAGIFASTKMVNKSPEGKDEAGIEAAKMNPQTVHIVEDGTPQDLNVFIRGNVERKGPLVEKRFIRVLCSSEPPPFKDGSGRRELAEAIANRNNPLTPRVFVNRVWGLFFGRPLVVTPSNFGKSGERPTHPELLDDLAVRFMEGGWSVKALVQEIVLSATYRQASTNGRMGERENGSSGRSKAVSPIRPISHSPTPSGVDPSNEFLSRMNRRRLTVEQLRDTVLFVSGQLNLGGGPSQDLDEVTNHRRTLYARVSRLKLNDLLMQFDYPDANVHAEKRSVTTTPLQKLFMLNSPFMLTQAKALAAQLAFDPKASEVLRLRRVYLLLYSREPDRDETKLALDFLGKPAAGELSRWDQLAQMLLASNEMIYVD